MRAENLEKPTKQLRVGACGRSVRAGPHLQHWYDRAERWRVYGDFLLCQ